MATTRLLVTVELYGAEGEEAAALVAEVVNAVEYAHSHITVVTEEP